MIDMVTYRNIVLIFLILMTHSMLRVGSFFLSDEEKKCADAIMNDFGWNIEEKAYVERRTIPKLAFLNRVLTSLETEYGKNFFQYLHTFVVAKEKTFTPRQFCVSYVQGLPSKDVLTRAHEEFRCCGQLFSKIPDSAKPETNYFLDSTNPTEVIKHTMWNLIQADVFHLGYEDYRFKYFHYLTGQYLYIDEIVMTPSEFCKLEGKYSRSEPNYYELLQSHYAWVHNLEIGESSSSSNGTNNN